MNKENIIRMALEVGLEQDGDNFFSPKSDPQVDVHITDLEAFAALVASAAVRETSAEYRLGWNDGQIAEREACANVCEQHGYEHYCGNVTDKLAETIRARGQA